MHILLVSMWYAPEPVIKPHDLAVELVRRGHRVTVITGFPNYPNGKTYGGYRVRPWKWEIMDGVHVLRVAHMVDRSRSAIRRVVSYSSFSFMASVLGGVLVERPDAIWTYQIGAPGVVLAFCMRTPLIHEVQDLWPEWGKIATSGLKSGLYAILKAQERSIYRCARVITTISKGFKRTLIAKGVPEAKIVVLPNWANEQNFRPVPRDLALGEKEGLSGCFNVIYGGNVGTAQGLGVLLSVAPLVRDLPRLQFVIIGDGVERGELAERAANQGLDNVRFLGGRPPASMASYFAFADALLLHLIHDPLYEITIPSKTYSYLASGRPILAAAAGDVADLVRDSGAGLVCPPEDPVALAQTLRRLYAMSPIERDDMGRAGRHAFLQNYTRAALVDRYETLLATLRGG